AAVSALFPQPARARPTARLAANAAGFQNLIISNSEGRFPSAADPLAVTHCVTPNAGSSPSGRRFFLHSTGFRKGIVYMTLASWSQVEAEARRIAGTDLRTIAARANIEDFVWRAPHLEADVAK